MRGGLKTKKGTSFMLLTRPANVSEVHFTKAAEFVPERWDSLCKKIRESLVVPVLEKNLVL